MHRPYRRLPSYARRIISLTLLIANLSLILLTTPAGLFPLAGRQTSLGSPAVTPPAHTGKALATLKDSSFLATTAPPIAISGKVTVGTAGFANVTMTLTSPDAGFTPRTIRSSSLGTYSFTNLPQGRNYRLTLSKTNYTFAPASRTFTNVSANVPNQNFVGTLITFRISGRVAIGTSGLGGVTMTLTRSRPVGVTPITVTSDSSGYYAFPNVPVAGSYTLKPSKRDYTFNQVSRSYTNLSANQTNQDFAATLNSYSISGNVIVKGVTVTLSGSATATAVSDYTGSYSFTGLTPAGNYTVTPSLQGYTFDSQSKSCTDLSANQIVDFAIIASLPHVLEYNGLSRGVNYGTFWQSGVDLGHFFWEFWAMPGLNGGSRYLLSDGYGGAHALLFGFYQSGTHYVIGGNIFDGAHTTSFESDEGPAPYEWGHYAVGWDGKAIVTYFDGVPVGMREWTGPRRTIGHSGGGGNLYIGGSNHQNLIGRIAQLRGYEGSNPLEDEKDANLPFSSFTPQTVFDCSNPFWQNCSLLSSLISPTRPVADLSGNNRVGRLGAQPPQYVIDPTAPTASPGGPPVPPIDTSPTPPPTPTDALVFDSFSRRNSTYAFDGTGGMGSTEGGSAGPQQWQYDGQAGQPAPFGILNARAVMLSNEAHAAWVSTGDSTVNLDVRVNRQSTFRRAGISTGLVFRFQDTNNFFFAYTTGATASTQTLYVSSVIDGSITPLASGVEMPLSWTTLHVVTLSTGSIEVYADETRVYSTFSDALIDATNAGIWNWGADQSLANRWDNFTVLGVPVRRPSGAKANILEYKATGTHRRDAES